MHETAHAVRSYAFPKDAHLGTSHVNWLLPPDPLPFKPALRVDARCAVTEVGGEEDVSQRSMPVLFSFNLFAVPLQPPRSAPHLKIAWPNAVMARQPFVRRFFFVRFPPLTSSQTHALLFFRYVTYVLIGARVLPTAWGFYRILS